MVNCWAYGCSHNNVRETCKFYRMPNDPVLRRKWINLVRRPKKPGPGSRLCSCHFVDGKKENMPTLFKHNEGKGFQFSGPEKSENESLLRKLLEASEQSTFFKTEAVAVHTTESETSLPSAPCAPIEEILLTEVQHIEPQEMLEPQPSTSRTNVISVVLVEAEKYYLEQDPLEGEKS